MSSRFPSHRRAVSTVASRFADAQALQTSIRRPLAALGFWAAVVLPFVALALLVTGLAAEQAGTFGLVVAANVVGLVLGRDHHAE